MGKYKEWKKTYASGDPEAIKEAKEDMHKYTHDNAGKIAAVTLGAVFVIGILVGVGSKAGWDSIFKHIPKFGVADIRNFPCKDGIGFMVYGKNLIGKTIVESTGYTDIESWVNTFVGSMKDPTVGATVTGLFMKQAPDALIDASPEVLKELGLTVKKF